MARADKLKQLGMPKKPMAEEEAGMDLELELGNIGGEKEEMGEDEMGMEEMGGEEMLADIEDDMLIKEMKKRGLSLDMDAEDGEADMEEEEDYKEEDMV